jgi:AcrR family transcriptional regulator
MHRNTDLASIRKATGRQARKSLATQRQIIETTIRCLAKYGYHDTTYIRISEESGISRGAMRHHFPSRVDIMKATIEHLHNKRLAAFRKAAASFPEGPSRTRANIKALWQHVNHPTFMVFIDLALAARKDRELAAIFRPAQRTFRQECYYAALELFPEWLKHREQLRTAIDLALYMMEGMVLDDLSPDGGSATRLLDFLARELDVLRTNAAVPGNIRDREAPSQKS